MPQIAKLQDKIVHCFANDIRERWDFLLINFGREKEDSERVSEIHEVIFQRDGNAWKRISVISPLEGQVLMNDLSLLMLNEGHQTWYGCTLEIDSTGRQRR